MSESIIVQHVDTLFVVGDANIIPSIKAARAKSVAGSSQADPAEQLAFGETVTNESDGYTDYDKLNDADKALADWGEELLDRQAQTKKSFEIRNLHLQAMFPLISTMNRMIGRSKSGVLPADSLLGANVIRQRAEKNAITSLAAACGHCALSEGCTIKAFTQWTRVHPYETRYIDKKRIVSDATREAIEKQRESRREFKKVLAKDPEAHCNPDQRPSLD